MSQQIDAAKHDRWARHLGLFAGSGLSIREFCRRRRLSEPSFYFWRRHLSARAAGKRPKRSANPAAAPPAEPRRGRLFVPLRVATTPGAAPDLRSPETPGAGQGRIDLLLGGGVTIRLRGSVPPARLAEVLAVLDRRGGRPC